ncbi:MAG: metallophosphatase [Lachnospiraceae bacterium]
MIYVTGDTHIPVDIHKLNTQRFEGQKSMTKDDYLIICGDFGLLFNYRETGNSAPSCPEDICWTKEELYWYEWLNEKPFTTLWVDGNHENFDRLKKYPTCKWNGGKVHMISDSIIHLMRGQIYEIDGYSILAFGGAPSHDRGIATGTEKIDAHKWWWKEELPTRKEYDQAKRNLKRRNNTVDFIISHEAPGVALHRLGLPQNEVSNKLWEIYDHTAFDKWYCGHHHIDTQYGRVRLLYDDIERIDNLKNYQIFMP